MARNKKDSTADYSLTLKNLHIALYERVSNPYTAHGGAILGFTETLTGQKLDDLLNQYRSKGKESEPETQPFISSNDYSRVLDLFSKTAFTKAGSQKLFFIAHLGGWRSAKVKLSEKTDVLFNGNNRSDGGVRNEFYDDLISWKCSTDDVNKYIFFMRNDSIGKSQSEKTGSISEYIVACNYQLISEYCKDKDVLKQVISDFKERMVDDEQKRSKRKADGLKNLFDEHQGEMKYLCNSLKTLMDEYNNAIDKREKDWRLARALSCLIIGAMLREAMTCDIIENLLDPFHTRKHEELKSSFSLIVPVNSIDLNKNNDLILNSDLPLSPISNTHQLIGSPLLTGENSPFYARYTLTNKQRREIGIHGNENRNYLLTKKSISFRIGKIHFWLFRGGISFITIQIATEKLGREQTLDLVAELCNIKVRSKIAYCDSVAKDVVEKREITIKTIIENILRLQPLISLRMTDETLQLAYCLYYGVGTVEDNESLLVFLEMIRNKTRSTLPTSHRLEKDNEFQPNRFKHIRWAVSQYTIACVACENIAHPEAREYIINKGGLQHSVFNNYLLVYLNCLAVNIRLGMLRKHYNIYHPSALRDSPVEAKIELQSILNIPLEYLTTEEHINTLFEKYLCRNVLGLQDQLKELSQANMLETIESITKSIEIRDENR